MSLYDGLCRVKKPNIPKNSAVLIA